MRAPDFIIGPKEDPYLRRWWVIPRNRWFNIYLHQILRDDDDRALHDHPWWNLSFILRGGYIEHTPGGRRFRGVRSLTLRKPTALHRLTLVANIPTWTLFITGPVVRVWGFACPQGWVPWQQFVDDRDNGQVGRGCGETEAQGRAA
jgi:hypothetical protein